MRLVGGGQLGGRAAAHNARHSHGVLTACETPIYGSDGDYRQEIRPAQNCPCPILSSAAGFREVPERAMRVRVGIPRPDCRETMTRFTASPELV